MSETASGINIVITIDHASITGWQAKVALESALGLKRAGYNPIVFAATAPVDPRLVEEGVEVVCLRLWSGPGTLRSSRRLSDASYDRFWADPLTLERHVERIGAI